MKSRRVILKPLDGDYKASGLVEAKSLTSSKMFYMPISLKIYQCLPSLKETSIVNIFV